MMEDAILERLERIEYQLQQLLQRTPEPKCRYCGMTEGMHQLISPSHPNAGHAFMG